MSEDNPKVPSLNDENYSLWVVWIEADLITCRLYNQVVCEVNTKEMTAEDAKTATADWKKKEVAEAQVAIIQRVEDSQLTHMRNWDPTIIWAKLACVHASCGLATCLALHRKFLTSVKADKEGMAAWIGWIKGLRYKLEDMILALTMGLNTLYSLFIISLDSTSTPTDKLTLEHVVYQLLTAQQQAGGREGRK
jgi:hypothetical protein